MKDLGAIQIVQQLLAANQRGSSETQEGILGRSEVAALHHLIRRTANARRSYATSAEMARRDNSLRLIYHDAPDANDPMVECPVCHNKGSLMTRFSLLKDGFNGITSGSPDDLDAQECGRCGAILEWDI